LVDSLNEKFSLERQDEMRQQISDELSYKFENLAIDIVFTGQSIWTDRAIQRKNTIVYKLVAISHTSRLNDATKKNAQNLVR